MLFHAESLSASREDLGDRRFDALTKTNVSKIIFPLRTSRTHTHRGPPTHMRFMQLECAGALTVERANMK
jgi:hypothetical protein